MPIPFNLTSEQRIARNTRVYSMRLAGMMYSEIAEATGLPESTVNNILKRARVGNMGGKRPVTRIGMVQAPLSRNMYRDYMIIRDWEDGITTMDKIAENAFMPIRAVQHIIYKWQKNELALASALPGMTLIGRPPKPKRPPAPIKEYLPLPEPPPEPAKYYSNYKLLRPDQCRYCKDGVFCEESAEPGKVWCSTHRREA